MKTGTPESILKAEYNEARELFPDVTTRSWEELTVDEKSKVEAVHHERNEFFRKLGQSIRAGAPFPKPLWPEDTP